MTSTDQTHDVKWKITIFLHNKGGENSGNLKVMSQ